MLNYIAISISVIIILFIILICHTRRIETNLLTGFWKADEDFCQEAELELFLVYIGEPSLIFNKRKGYILVKNAEGLIINNPVEFSLSGGLSANPSMAHERCYTLYIDWLGEDGYYFFPSEQQLYYYPQHGKLVMSADDNATAVLFKDYQLSAEAYDDCMPDTLVDDWS